VPNAQFFQRDLAEEEAGPPEAAGQCTGQISGRTLEGSSARLERRRRHLPSIGHVASKAGWSHPCSPYPWIMHLTIPETIAPETLVLAANSFSGDDEFLALCAANPDLRMERTGEGEVLIMAPCGGESSSRNAEALLQLGIWSRQGKGGQVFDSSGGFRLPNGAIRAADAAWVKRDRLAKLPKLVRGKFIPLSPDFVIEMISPSDQLSVARSKMHEWVEQGVPLAWLIIPDERLVEIYRPGQPVQSCPDVQEVRGEGALEGFILTLEPIWEGI
jgi:Uma2 family endonuclease